MELLIKSEELKDFVRIDIIPETNEIHYLPKNTNSLYAHIRGELEFSHRFQKTRFFKFLSKN